MLAVPVGLLGERDPRRQQRPRPRDRPARRQAHAGRAARARARAYPVRTHGLRRLPRPRRCPGWRGRCRPGCCCRWCSLPLAVSLVRVVRRARRRTDAQRGAGARPGMLAARVLRAAVGGAAAELMDVRVATVTLTARATRCATASGILRERELLLLRLRDDDGAVGWGEAAPLEPYDGVSLAEVRDGARGLRGDPARRRRRSGAPTCSSAAGSWPTSPGARRDRPRAVGPRRATARASRSAS